MGVEPTLTDAATDLHNKEEQPTKKQRSSSKKGSKNDDQQLSEAENLSMDSQVRKFWQKVDTRLISAWLLDYQFGAAGVSKAAKAVANQVDASMKSSREALIDHLVVNRDVLVGPKGYPSIKGDEFKQALASLREVWARLNLMESINIESSAWPSIHKEIKSPTTPSVKRGLKFDDHSSSASESEHDAADDEVELKQEKVREMIRKEAALALSVSQLSEKLAALQKMPSTAVVASAASTSSSHISQVVVSCSTCLIPHAINSITNSSGKWICTGCGLRGDLPANAAENVALLEKEKMNQSTSTNSKSDGSAGEQSSAITGQITAETRHKNRLDIEFERMTNEGESFEAFIKDRSPHADEWVKQAIELQREQVDGMGYEYPSTRLLQLVQSGKLTSVGWALPRRFGAAIDESGLGISVVGNQLRFGAHQKLPHEKLGGINAFLLAVLGTILPALIGQPHALMQWLALTRNVMHLKELHGWDAAERYLDQVLAENIRKRQPISTVINNAVDSARAVSLVKAAAAAGGHNNNAANGNQRANKEKKRDNTKQQQRPQSEVRSANYSESNKKHRNVCRDFNSAAGCHRTECRFAHERSSSSSVTTAHHQASSSSNGAAPVTSSTHAGGGK